MRRSQPQLPEGPHPPLGSTKQPQLNVLGEPSLWGDGWDDQSVGLRTTLSRDQVTAGPGMGLRREPQEGTEDFSMGESHDQGECREKPLWWESRRWAWCWGEETSRVLRVQA